MENNTPGVNDRPAPDRDAWGDASGARRGPDRPFPQTEATVAQTEATAPAEPAAATGTGGRRGPGWGALLATGLVTALIGGGIGGLVVLQTAEPATAVNQLERPAASSEQQREPAPEGSVEAVADAVLPAVVSIQVVNSRGAAEGSGSIISSDGLVLTNAHVASGADEPNSLMQVTLNDGTTHEAELVAADAATDIAVVQIKDVTGLPTMEFGDSSQLRVGQPVVAVGSPLGLSSTVTTGIVSAVNRPVRASAEGGQSTLIDAVQTDAAINPGNSGGPLVDMEGRLIGMNSVIASMPGAGAGESAGSIGLGFAIPANFAQRVAKQLVDHGEASQPMLGLQVRPDPRVPGAVVAEVPDGPAKEAGIQPGEVVTKVNDRVVDSADALIAAVRTHDFGETVHLEVRSHDGGEPRIVDVTLTSE